MCLVRDILEEIPLVISEEVSAESDEVGEVQSKCGETVGKVDRIGMNTQSTFLLNGCGHRILVRVKTGGSRWAGWLV